MATINGTSGNDTLNGTTGTDTINGLAGDDIINGNGGTDTIDGGDGNDTITTGSGDDNITTGTGVDNVTAGAGNDSIYCSSSGGTFDGGDGYDSFVVAFAGTSAALSVVVSDSIQISNGITVTNVESLSFGGGSGDDVVTVNRFLSSGTLYGGGGHDTIVFDAPAAAGLQFSVVAYSGDQLDGVIGTTSIGQTFSQFESVSFTGSQYDDQFQVRADSSAVSADITFDGAGGTDTLTADFSFSSGATNLVVAADGTITSNRGHYAHIEVFGLTGGAGADTMITGAGADTLAGGAGADHLDGGAGDDFLYSSQYVDEDDGAADVLIGGAGNDRIAAGYGDSVDGGAGFDRLYYAAQNGSAGINADFSTLTSGGTISVGGVTLTGIEAIEQVTGTNFNDTIIAGTPGLNTTRIFGLAGNDHITGSSGAESIYGGDGDDILTGGGGHDELYGADGSDTFRDTAANFNGDTIDLTPDDKIIITDANINSFTFSLTGGYVTYAGGSFYIGTQLPGHVVASAAAGGGVELKLQLPPVATNDQIASELINGFWNWNGEGAHHFNVGQGGAITIDIHTLNSTEQSMARAAFGQWHDIIGVTFKEVLSGAQILITHEEDPAMGGAPSAYTEDSSSGGITGSAHIHISSSWVTTFGSALGSYGFQTYLHEIGHALGLGHSGDYNQTADYSVDAKFANDSYATTVMSYFDQQESYYFGIRHFSILSAGTPMQADILAAQQLYGIPTSTRPGDTIYGNHSNAGGPFDAIAHENVAYTIFDSGGNDTIDYSLFGTKQLIDLNPETFSNVGNYTGNLSIARGVIIENALGGAGDDTLIGNSVANHLVGNGGADILTGNGGNDTLDGGDGADQMSGGAGNDTYIVDTPFDTVEENAGEGTDLVKSSASITLAANIENLTLTGNTALTGTGNSLDNAITGNNGSNVINGGNGADTMIGGLGSDTYYVDNLGDVVTENASAGTDLVKATISYALGANLENLTLSGSASDGTGNTLANTIRGTNGASTLDGGDGNDLLMGNGGDDTLIGGAGNDKINGGTGSDKMTGGVGDDTYYVDTLSDVVVENAGEGTADKVISTIDYSLGANIERLMLYGTDAIDGSGNSLANVLYGNGAANVMYGLAGDDTLFGHGGSDILVGGSGRDTMIGGANNDTFRFADGDFGGATRATADRITDFTSGQDKLDLSAVDANTLLASDQGFSFLGTSSFTHTAGELRVEQVSGNTYVSGDTNGDGIADFMIKLDGLNTLNASDFML